MKKFALWLSFIWALLWVLFGIASGISQKLAFDGVALHVAVPGLIFLGFAVYALINNRIGGIGLVLVGFIVSTMYPVITHGRYGLGTTVIVFLTMAFPPLLAGLILATSFRRPGFMITPSGENDFYTLLEIINDSAKAYKGVIPEEFQREPYMTAEALRKDMEAGVKFYSYSAGGKTLGVMALQDFPDVSLIRHAYVRLSAQKQGIGSALLKYLLPLTKKPVLIGTWASTEWSIQFYKKHGFRVVPKAQAQELLKKYWPMVEQSHRDASVVLADTRYLSI